MAKGVDVSIETELSNNGERLLIPRSELMEDGCWCFGSQANDEGDHEKLPWAPPLHRPHKRR